MHSHAINVLAIIVFSSDFDFLEIKNTEHGIHIQPDLEPVVINTLTA